MERGDYTYKNLVGNQLVYDMNEYKLYTSYEVCKTQPYNMGNESNKFRFNVPFGPYQMNHRATDLSKTGDIV